MSKAKSSRAISLALELVVVFLGVLIALAVDSMRQSRLESKRELAYMVSLQSDMNHASNQLDSAIARTRTIVSEYVAFRMHLQSDLPIPDSVGFTPIALVGLSMPMGTLDALLQTGDLNLITHDQLRSEIIVHSASLRSNVANRALLHSVVMDALAELLVVVEEVRVAKGHPPPLPTPEALRGEPRVTASYLLGWQIARQDWDVLNDMKESVQTLLQTVQSALESRR